MGKPQPDLAASSNKGVEAAVGLLNMLALRQTLSPLDHETLHCNLFGLVCVLATTIHAQYPAGNKKPTIPWTLCWTRRFTNTMGK